MRKLPDIEAMELQLLALTHPRLRVVRESKTLSVEVGRNPRRLSGDR